MTRTEFELYTEDKHEKKPEEKVVSAAGIENEVPLVVRPKVRTQAQIMTGARPKTKTKVVPGTWPKTEARAMGSVYTKYKIKKIHESRSKDDAQTWALSEFGPESISKMEQESQINVIISPGVSSDSGSVANTKCLFMDRESINIDNESFPGKKVHSQVGFPSSFVSGKVTDSEPWSYPRHISKQKPSQNSDFNWVDKSVNSWFWSQEEVNGRFHPRNRIKASTRSKYMSKQEATNYSRHKNKQDLYIVSSSSGSEDESLKTSWFCGKQKTNPLSKSREEVNSRSWFRSEKEVNIEFSPRSEYENAMKSWFWDREETKYSTLPRTRKETNERARYSPKQEACIETMTESTDVNQKESWFWPEEKGNTFLRCNTKKESRAQAMEKEEARTRDKREERPQEETFIETWFWATEESSLMDVPSIKSSPQLKDESIIGSWFWTEEEVSMETRSSSKSRLEVKELIDNSCLGDGEKTSIEMGAEATSQSILAANDEEVIVGSWFWAGEEVNPEPKEETIFGAWFWSTDEASGESDVGISCESRPRSAEEVIGPWLWAGEVSIGAGVGEEFSQESEEETMYLSWFWSENQTSMDSATEASSDVPGAEEEEDPMFGSWFWARVDACEESTVNSKSSLEDEEAIISSSFVAREEANMKYGAGARCKFMAETEDTNKSCFWAEEEPCMYHASRRNWKFRAEEEEDIADSRFWSRKYTRPEALVGSWLWAAEEGSTDYKIRQEAMLPTKEKTMTKSQFWKEDKDTTIEVTDRKESWPEAEEEDIIGSWFWSEEEDRLEAQREGREENSLGVEEEESVFRSCGKQEAVTESGFSSKYSSKADAEEVIVGSWFWEQETSLEAVTADTFESKTGTEEEEIIVGSWFWPKEANIEAGSQAVEETRSKTEEKTILESCCAKKEVNIEAGMCCVSKPEYDEEMIVEAWFWSTDKTIKETGTVATCECRSQDDEEEVVETWCRATDEVNNGTDDGTNCESRILVDEEDIVGSWFWIGDEAHFESNPSPVFRATCESWGSVKEEPDLSHRPQSWEEVTIQFKPGPWGRVGFPSLSSFIFPREAAPLFSELFGENRHVERIAEDEEQESFLHVEPEFSFQYDPSYRSVQEVREHLRAKESAESESWSCNCIQCELRIDSEEFEELLLLMDRIQDPFIHEISKIAMGMRRASQFTRDFIRESGVVSLIETLLNYPSSRDKTRFLKEMILTAPSYPNLNMIQTYVCQVCEETLAYSVDSPEQLSGLRMIRYLTTTTDYHTLVANYMSGFLTLLATGNNKTRFHVLEMLLNLSENFIMMKELLSTEAVSEFMGLFYREETNDNIQIVLAIFENIGTNIRKDTVFIDDDDDDFSLEPLISIYHEVEKFAKQLQSKIDNQNDPEADQEN
ncbi:G-protein coupled receptor-associated sorting protein 1 [Heterocephalus glaber]|uniref:G-protein coupled receptor-associated sorting protein 1 n=1 Tax=Heterocephalus glaber TaxID=10181 RepID=G5B0C2_HETGA|nr:G-protein coupled receptor-associated sorting protein 1 [Heterocephalus glaber]EHB02733.1 G-protein coupled receptor-associated sorting protein 1 [Heterocephalus glaber]